LAQKEEDNDKNNHSIDGVNCKWAFNRELLENNTNNNDENGSREMELKMAALEVPIPIFHNLTCKEFKFISFSGKMHALRPKRKCLKGRSSRMLHLLAEELQKMKEEKKALRKKLEETEQKAKMVKNEVKNMVRNLV
jgi:hypothetical protein